jgi:hypothetical protein
MNRQAGAGWPCRESSDQCLPRDVADLKERRCAPAMSPSAPAGIKDIHGAEHVVGSAGFPIGSYKDLRLSADTQAPRSNPSSTEPSAQAPISIAAVIAASLSSGIVVDFRFVPVPTRVRVSFPCWIFSLTSHTTRGRAAEQAFRFSEGRGLSSPPTDPQTGAIKTVAAYSWAGLPPCRKRAHQMRPAVFPQPART